MSALQAAIAECLSLHAQAVEKLGTDQPEMLPKVPPAIRAKIATQRERVNATLSGVAPEVHVAHVESLNAGLRLILKKLAPEPPKQPPPPLPVWDDQAKAWRVPDPGQIDTGDPGRPFDDRIDDLF
jgi:hypothetical protein